MIPRPLHPRFRSPLRFALPLALLFIAPGLSAADIADAWARATVPGQTAAAAYMTITSRTPARLVGASSSAAGVTQVHEMSMQGTTMRMRPLDALDLPEGRPVTLKPGGLHVMLMELKQPLKVGDRFPLVLRIEGADRKAVDQTVSVEVRSAASAAAAHPH